MNTFAFTLDLSKTAYMEPLRIRQGDHNGTTVQATILDHGVALSGSYTARFCMRHPGTGATYYRETGTYANGVATVALDEQYAASVPGRTTAYIQLLQGSTVIASTSDIPVVILHDATEDAVPGEVYDSAIEDALAELDEATGRISVMVQEQVAEELAAHPEWTTTVQDNSVTDAKLIQSGGILSRNARLMYRLANLLTHRTDEGTLAAISDAAKTPMAGLSVYGQSTQDGTPTPSSPVPIVSVEGDSEGNISLVAQLTSDASVTTTTPIDLDGHELRSLPDGTRDELTVDALGHVTLVQRVGVVTLDGTENWSASSTANVAYKGISDARKESNVDNALCDHFAASIETLANMADPSFKLGLSGGANPAELLYFKSSSVITSVADLKTWLASNPTTVTYPLAEPVTHDLGTVPLVALVGPDLTAQTVPSAPFVLTYERDATIVLDRLTAMWGNVAPVEGDTASANYSVGSYLMHGGQLCKVTTAIATGETITIGTNVVATTVMAEVIALTQ